MDGKLLTHEMVILFFGYREGRSNVSTSVDSFINLVYRREAENTSDVTMQYFTID